MAKYTQAQLDALRQAIAIGALTVTSNGETITYRSQAEMLRMEEIMAADLATSAGTSRTRTVRFTTSKGV